MGRNLIAAVLLLAAFAGIAAQTPTDGMMEVAAPVMAETPTDQPDPTVVIPTEPVAAPAAAVPVAAAPLPSKPTFNENLLVTPEEVTATMAFLDTVFKTNPNVQTACLPEKIMVSAMRNLLLIPNHLAVVESTSFSAQRSASFMSQLPLSLSTDGLLRTQCHQLRSRTIYG